MIIFLLKELDNEDYEQLIQFNRTNKTSFFSYKILQNFFIIKTEICFASIIVYSC